MISVLASNAIARNFSSPRRVKPNIIKYVFVTSLLSTKH